MTSTPLLDANVLIAALVKDHEHHEAASDWIALHDSFAICPIVEGALIRFLLRLGESGATAAIAISALHDNPRCTFWADSVSYRQVPIATLRGHRQVTDAYLVALAAANNSTLATFDQALAATYPDAVQLING